MPDIQEIIAEVRARPRLPDHETDEAAWAEWVLTPEGTAAILRDEIYALSPVQRLPVRIDRLKKSCNNTGSIK